MRKDDGPDGSLDAGRFRTYVTADTPEDYFLNVLSPKPLSQDEISTQVPILMYHHLSEDVTNSEMVSPEQFEAQIRALAGSPIRFCRNTA